MGKKAFYITGAVLGIFLTILGIAYIYSFYSAPPGQKSAPLIITVPPRTGPPIPALPPPPPALPIIALPAPPSRPAPPISTPDYPSPGPAAPTSSPTNALDRILANLEWGNIAFNVPPAMNLQETAMVHLVLGLKKPIDELSRMISAEARGDREGASIRISNRMEARLSGPNFQITAATPEEQAISANEVTEWKWDIKPTSLGVQRIHLTLSAILNIDGNSTKRVIRTFDRTIEIKITGAQRASGFLQQNWQWLWAAIILPVAGWLWRRKRKKTGAKQADHT